MIIRFFSDAGRRSQGVERFCLWENDSQIYSEGWDAANVAFLRKTLTMQFVSEKLRKAVEVLSDEPEFAIVQHVQDDWLVRTEIVESRVQELPVLLGMGTVEQDGWRV